MIRRFVIVKNELLEPRGGSLRQYYSIWDWKTQEVHEKANHFKWEGRRRARFLNKHQWLVNGGGN